VARDTEVESLALVGGEALDAMPAAAGLRAVAA
jgi:hypothetical protein